MTEAKMGANPSSGGEAPLIDYNPLSLTVEESYAFYAKARAQCPVARSEALGGFHLLTRYDDIRAAAADWSLFSSAKLGVGFREGRAPARLVAIEMDPPEHFFWRKLYMAAVTPAALKLLEPQLAAMANTMIDGFAGTGHADLIRQFAEPLPVLGMCKATGFSADDPAAILEIAHDFTASAGDNARRGGVMQRIAAVTMQEISDRRRMPRDDYMTRIALTEVDGALIPDFQLALFFAGFLVAGHETTTSALGGLLGYILVDPVLKERVSTDDAALNAAIEEAVRLISPFHGFSRGTTAATEINGVKIGEDELVRLCYASANRDPEHFENPDRFDIDRPRKPHMGFGYGPHVCAGAPLARLEMRVAVRELLRRLPDIEARQPDPGWRLVGGVLATPVELQASFTPG